MNYTKIRHTACLTSLIALLLILTALSGKYAFAGTDAAPMTSAIPKEKQEIPNEQTAIPGQDLTLAGNDTGSTLAECAQIAAAKVQGTAVVTTYAKPLVASGNEKVKEVEEKKAKEKAAAATKASASSSSGVTYTYNGSVLTASKGINMGPSGKESYYNLNMSRIVAAMSAYGYRASDYWVRGDGVKMLGNYVMVAANYSVHPKGSTVATSLGTGIVCDTGGFAAANPTQIDIATAW